MSLAAVSKRITQLEARVGVRLLQRTTRKQVLTEEGRLVHTQIVRVLSEIDEMERLLAGKSRTVEGMLRVGAPAAFGRRFIAPNLVEFQRLHPRLTIELDLTDDVVDLHERGLDLAVRFGSLADSSLVAQKLAPNYRVLCAAPDYLRAHGEPEHPSDLLRHHCILRGRHSSATWRFTRPEVISLEVNGAFLSNDGEAAHRFALAGAGIIVKSIWDVGDDIAAGALKIVLPGYEIPAAPLHAIYPHSRGVAPRVRTFVEFLRTRLRQDWRWPQRAAAD